LIDLASGSMDGRIVDVVSGEIFHGRIEFSDGIIKSLRHTENDQKRLIIPGLIDAHIHIESSHLCPSRFAEAVVPHGTAAVVSDPHEIANVFGVRGIKFMIDDSKKCPLRCYFTAPSCVPATAFERSGAVITHEDIQEILSWPEVVALGEMMNYPGAAAGDEEILLKIRAAKKAKKPIDGHAPLVTGDTLRAYVSRGITTDHECTTSREAAEKHRLGMIIQIRQGTACKNLPSLKDFAKENPFMLVSDDRSAHDLLKGHLDMTIREAISLGIEPLRALRAATLYPAEHYNLPGGWLEEERAADFAIIDSFENFNVLETWIAGSRVAVANKPAFDTVPESIDIVLPPISKHADEFAIRSNGAKAKARIIVVVKDEIVTDRTSEWLTVSDNELLPDIDRDVLRISVVNRYENAPVSNGFVKGFGLKSGAIASTVAHDSHNCIVVGSDRNEMASAANLSLAKGGFTVFDKGRASQLELPIGGLMSNRPAIEVSRGIDKLLDHTRKLGCTISNPLMTLSFMSLLVIPKLKIGDRGLFDSEKFEFVDVIEEISNYH